MADKQQTASGPSVPVGLFKPGSHALLSSVATTVLGGMLGITGGNWVHDGE